MAKVVSDFPHKVEVIENSWIPLSDGMHLAARIWMPENARSKPVPGILEYIPYRKRDMTRERDEEIHHYFAGNGYVSIRVDLRGSGDSEGLLTDEYLEQELADGEEVLRWMANQPWCNGNIGVIGKSWGGFNGLQLAYRQPRELKAVITVCSTDDRYADDVHYMGGCLLGDNLSWASTMFAYNSLPPDVELAGGSWRDMWFDRLKGSGLWLDDWLRHQHRDEYWKHGSICEDFSRVQCPVFAVSGWADGYTNAVFRLMENLDVPRKALVGPWSHKYPHNGVPGPAIGFLQECVRWWDHCLKGQENGIMEEPMIRVWMQDWVPPSTGYRRRPGRWIAENSWPSSSIKEQCHQLEPYRIAACGEEVEENKMTIQSPLSVGLFAGKWCSYSATPDLPHDQREEDGGALIFDSEPLESDMEIFGAPVIDLQFEVNKPVAMVAVRLSGVSPDDRATRVTYGLLNLCHRNGHEHPEKLEAGKVYKARVQMNDIAQVFPKGYRFRVSLSTSYWPLAWPPPEPVRLTIYAGKSMLTLPVRKTQPLDEQLKPFGEPEKGPGPTISLMAPSHSNWWVKRDLANDISTLEVIKDDGIKKIDAIDLEVEESTQEWYSYYNGDFNSVRGEVFAVRGLKRGDWHVRTITRTVLTSDVENFHLRAELDAYEGDTRVFSKNWNKKIPRRFV